MRAIGAGLAAGTSTDGTASGALRFVLASSIGGGAPRDLLLNLDTSAIVCHSVDEGLNQGVGPLVEGRVTGFGNRVSDVLRLPIGWPLK